MREACFFINWQRIGLQLQNAEIDQQPAYIGSIMGISQWRRQDTIPIFGQASQVLFANNTPI